MNGDLRLRNRQRARAVDLRLLRRAVIYMLDELPEAGEFDITIHLVNAPTMARLNEKHLQHSGPTDVITLDYAADGASTHPFHSLSPHKGERAGLSAIGLAKAEERGPIPRTPSGLVGEIFVCVDVAADQARRFRTSWPLELARYAIHGILHLAGHDDQQSAARRSMKQAENRWLRKLDRRFHLRKLARKTRLAP